MISSQKDRVMIIGGKEQQEESECSVVEEIDFLKRNIVNLAPTTYPRANANGFLVNDSIYVFGGCSNGGGLGEKYALSENKWREVKFQGAQSQSYLSYKNVGAASLLYE